MPAVINIIILINSLVVTSKQKDQCPRISYEATFEVQEATCYEVALGLSKRCEESNEKKIMHE